MVGKVGGSGENDLEVSKHFELKNHTRKIDKIRKDFWIILSLHMSQNVLITPGQNLSIPLDYNVFILLLSNIYNRNVRTFWHI